ncbi:MAG: TraB/GumN family protein, partial [Amphiplicatus sp.]
ERKAHGFRKTLVSAALGAAVLVPAAAFAGDAPAMWRLKDADSEIYLFGTFHVFPANVPWTTSAFDKAMEETETTITEADVTSPEAQAAMFGLVQKYGLNPQGVTLSSTLGPDRAAEIERIAGSLGVPMATLEPYRPWLALVSLASMAMQSAGFDPASGVERVVIAKATSQGDEIEYFETAEEQIKILAGLDDEEMLANFDVTIEQFDDFKALTEGMLASWKAGDLKALEADILAPLRDSSPAAFRDLIVARNESWVSKIAAIMEGEGDYFIAVGAGHLIGEDSVVDLLGERGFAVERVQ